MKYSLIILFMLISICIQAEQKDSCIADPDLAMRADWSVIPGFDSALLLPGKSAAASMPIQPSLNLQNLKSIEPGKTYTLFLDFVVNTVCQQPQYLNVQQSCASRIYLDGQLIANFGEWGADDTGVRAFNPMNQPILLPDLLPGKHRLAVVFVTQPGIQPKWMFGKTFPLFSSRIMSRDLTFDYYSNSWQIGLDYLNTGVILVLFLIHFFSFLVNPASKLQLWFAFYAFLFLAMAVSGMKSHSPHYTADLIRSLRYMSVYRLLSLIFLTITFLDILKPVQWKWGVVIFISFSLEQVNGWISPSSIRPLSDIFSSIFAGIPVLFLTYRKMQQGNPSAKFLFRGILLYVLTWTLFILTLSMRLPALWYDIIFHIAILIIPLTISMVISLQSRLTNRQLEKETAERIKLADENRQMLLHENQKLEIQVAERTEGLEKKNRELEIEASLAKVRESSLAMESSQDLSNVVRVMFDEISRQWINLDEGAVLLFIFSDDKPDYISHWLADPGYRYTRSFHFPVSDHALCQDLIKARNEKKEFLAKAYTKEEKNAYFKFMFEQSSYRDLADEVKQLLLQSEHYAISAAFCKDIAIAVTSNSGNLIKEPQKTLIIRMAREFDQTYTRFLDLKKAESQARDAEIELGLERVRARTMAMHRSEELKDIIQVVVDQMVQLKIFVEHAGFILDYKEREDMNIWLADKRTVPYNVTIPYFDSPHWNSFREAKKQNLKFFANQLGFEEKNKFYQELFKLFPVPEETKEYYNKCEGLAFSTVLLDNIGLYIENFSGVPYSDEDNNTLMRFGNVFQQSYTRFLDLQKAEANFREAQIEASLEKVRAKAMAMHTPQDITDTIGVFYRELQNLCFTPKRCGVGLISKEHKSVEVFTWNTTKAGESVEVAGKEKLEGHPVLENVFEHWLAQTEYHTVLRGKELTDYYKIVQPQIHFPDNEGDQVQYGYFFFFNEGGVYAWTGQEMLETELQIYRRFTSVLSLTYKRYIDLRQAETNAKETLRQATLDRLRAEIASMRSVEDLQRITPLIWNELTILNVPFTRCGIFIMEDEVQRMHTFLSTPSGEAIASFYMPYNKSPNIADMVAHWQQRKIYVSHWGIEEFSAVANTLVEQGAFSSPGQYLKSLPADGFYLHFLPFIQGMLYVGNTYELSNEDLEMAGCIAKAFATAYARYEDFTKLEAANHQIENTLTNLRQAQQQLVHSEKMAGLGELTAGIAHEIQNPLNFVNNFSEINSELSEEILAAAARGDMEEVTAIATDIKNNQRRIYEHGKRADSIVKSMLQHSRTSTGVKEPTDLNKLADEYVRLSYHGMRSKNKSFNAEIVMDLDQDLPHIPTVTQDIGRVLLNIFNNAFYAVQTRQCLEPNLKGVVKVCTRKNLNHVVIAVSDNGNGIPEINKDKIFQPFFTTKSTGEGTGLGLSLSYDIITKGHAGEIHVESEEGRGTTLLVKIPTANN